MTSAQTSDGADVIRADFQMVISRHLQNISTYLFCTAEADVISVPSVI